MKARFKTGALTSTNKKADINRLAIEECRKYFENQAISITAALFAALIDVEGFGHDRLLRIFNESNRIARELGEKYEMPDDVVYLLKRKCKSKGIDLDELMRG